MFRDDMLKTRQPWWVFVIFALVVGYGTAQDTVRHLAGTTGWELVGKWILIAASVVIFFGCSWIAIVKFRERDAGHAA